MAAVEDRLAEIEALAAEATEGPWTTEPGSWIEGGYVRDGRGSLLDGSDASCEVGTERLEDAAFITAARTLVPELVAALRAVLMLADELDTPPGPSVYTSDVAVVRREVAHQVASRIREAVGAALGVTL